METLADDIFQCRVSRQACLDDGKKRTPRAMVNDLEEILLRDHSGSLTCRLLLDRGRDPKYVASYTRI